MLRQIAVLQGAQHLDPVHLRHHHVQQDGAQPLRVGEDLLQALPAVFRLLDGVVGGENVFQNAPVDGVVVDDQQRMGGQHGSVLKLFVGHGRLLCLMNKNRKWILTFFLIIEQICALGNVLSLDMGAPVISLCAPGSLWCRSRKKVKTFSLFHPSYG